MKPLTRSFLLSAALACAGHAGPAAAQSAPRAAEAPLEGAAYQFADEGYKSYDAGNYAQAQQQAESAIALRPDVERLRLLLIYALQKQGKLREADKAAADAIESGLDTPALRQARANLRPRTAPAAAAGGGAPGATAAYRRGFPIATRAYADYNRGDYVAAQRGAEQAFRIDPKQGPWAMLWLDALEAQGKYAEAQAAADKAIALGAPNKNDLTARRATMQRRLAIKPAEQGYQALIANRPGDAVPLAREAVALAPDTASHRLLLMTALMLDNQLGAAEDAATDALGQDDENTVALVMRAYLRQRQGKTDEANADFDAALKQDWLDDDQRRNVRLIAADAALAGGETKRALALLEPLGAKDEAAAARIKRARSAPTVPATLTLANYPAPLQDCRDTPYGTSCELLPSDAAGSGGPAALAYAAYAREDYQEAIAQARKAAEQDPANKELQRLLTTTLAAGNAAQLAEAEKRMGEALSAQPDDPALLMQRGYLHQRMGKPRLALEDFQAARATGKAPPTVILDEGYALSGVGDKRGAVEKLKQAIDEADAGKLELTPQQRYDTRSGIAGLSREWGGYVSAGYRGARPASSGLGGAAITVPGDAVFSTAEIFWRPSDFLNSSTRTFELYGRLSNTLYDNGSRTKSQTVRNRCGEGVIDVAGQNNDGIAGTPHHRRLARHALHAIHRGGADLRPGAPVQPRNGDAHRHPHSALDRYVLRPEQRQPDRPLQGGRRQRRLARLRHLRPVRRHDVAHRPARLVHDGRLCAGRVFLAGHAGPVLAARQRHRQGHGQRPRQAQARPGVRRGGIADRAQLSPGRHQRKAGVLSLWGDRRRLAVDQQQGDRCPAGRQQHPSAARQRIELVAGRGPRLQPALLVPRGSLQRATVLPGPDHPIPFQHRRRPGRPGQGPVHQPDPVLLSPADPYP